MIKGEDPSMLRHSQSLTSHYMDACPICWDAGLCLPAPASRLIHMFAALTTHLVVRIHVDFGRARNMMCRP